MAKNEKISLGENVSVPVHVGVIMDGNGRWAKKRGICLLYTSDAADD